MKPLSILQYRVDDRSYPRNSRIRSSLRSAGHRVAVHDRSRATSLVRRALVDLRSLIIDSRGADVIVVSEFSLPFVPFAWAVAKARRAVLVVDCFVFRYETTVLDWGARSPRSLRAWIYRLIDWWSVALADVVLVDTRVRAARIRSGGRRRQVALSLPVGAPGWVSASPHSEGSPLRVLFYGSYLPLHGVPTIVRALIELRDEDVRFTFVGTAEHDGGVQDMQRLADEGGAAHLCRFLDAVPVMELDRLLAEHDVVLGVFGGSEKAGSVIANKVWQGLAAGRVVVTRESPALDEIRDLVGDQLRTVPPEDPLRLASQLRRLLAEEPSDYTGASASLEQYVTSEFECFLGELERRARR